MNLGDGLVLEFENGKPKVVLSHLSLELRNLKEVPITARTSKVLRKSQQVFDEAVSEKPQRALRCADSRKKIDTEVAAIGQENKEASKASSNLTLKDTRVSFQVKVPARARTPQKSKKHKQASAQKQSAVSTESSKESMVCLTQEQLQMILSSISQTSGKSSGNPNHSSEPLSGGSKDEMNVDPSVSGTEKRNSGSVSESAHDKNDSNPVERMTSNGLAPDLFGTLGEREREKKALEAKKEQWKKELDEQMAAKQQQKARAEAELDCSPWGTQGGGVVSKPNLGHTRLGDERASRTASDLDNGCQSKAEYYKSQQDLPAAIRSAFVLGEAAPLEHAFSAKKREQQRRWLQELDQQREETKLRRMKEKLDHARGEDLERWAMHFDSHQKRSSFQLPLPADEQELEPHSSHSASQQQSPMGTTGEEHLDRESVDTIGGVPPRARYLRTMTALLDPAQIKDRERKRLKELEHQRVILAQVEERRRQREQEAALRQAEEQAEERRVALEWERQQQQYQLDTLRQKQKEVKLIATQQELQTRKTEELYLSVQRAQEEAMIEKQLQRIRELAIKGHDVSKLLVDREKASASTHTIKDTSQLTTGSLREHLQIEPETFSVFSKRDTAVQTDADLLNMGWASGAAVGRVMATRTPDGPAEYRVPSNVKKPKQDVRMLERNLVKKGKENIHLEDAAEVVDPYQAFTRTDRQRGGRTPWNTRKPTKPFVPASERYPPELQQHRQESRLRRQMELLTLVEKNSTSRVPHREPSPPQPAARHREEHFQRSSMITHQVNGTRSPPVPAVERRLQQETAQPTSLTVREAAERPPSSNFIPYVRTDEVYHLDPLAPISRPSTQQHQLQAQPGADQSRSTSATVQPDPLLNPELLKNNTRQQAILKRLSELRQGLLQKQKELESGLNPLLLGQGCALPSTDQPL